MSENANEVGHGDSVASWTAVIIMMVASATGTLAFWFDQAALVWASAALFAAGLVAGIVLKKLGYGVGGKNSKNKH